MPTRNRILAVMTFALVGVVTLAGCEITDPTEGTTLYLDYEAGKTYVNGKIVDAHSGETITDHDMIVTVFGPDAGEVRGIEGARKNEFTPEHGTVSFVLRKEVSESDPADIRVRVQADGYLETTEPLSVIEENASFQVTLVPAGRAVPADMAAKRQIEILRSRAEAEQAELGRQAIDELRPVLQRDGGDVELIEIDGNKVYVKLLGQCAGCQMATVTISGIQQRLMEALGEPVRVIPAQMMAAE